MILRVWCAAFVCLACLLSCQCFSGAGEQLVDNVATVELPETGLNGNEEMQEPTRSRRLKRSSWSLPRNTSARFVLDTIMPIPPLNNTFSALTLNLIFRFVLPTYTQLYDLYTSLGRLDDDNNEPIIEGQQSNTIDVEFFEEQRANRERRAVYQHAEGIFEQFGFDGQTCFLRALCEMAEAPLAHLGLMGQLIDLLFIPKLGTVPKGMKSYLSSNRIRRDVTAIPELEVLHTPIEDAYTEAYLTGKEGKCWTRYYSCPISLFKIHSY